MKIRKKGVLCFLSRWEQDYKLQAWDQMSLFDEYLEMVIQVKLEMVIHVKQPRGKST